MNKYYFYKIYDLILRSEIILDEYEEIKVDSDIKYDFQILYGVETYDIIRKKQRGINQNFSLSYIWFYAENIATYQIIEGKKILVTKDKDCDHETVKAYLIGTCMGYILFQKNILAIHGAVVANKDKASIIIGDSGSGKSTISMYLQNKGYGFLSDDIARIFDGDKLCVSSGYPGQRLCEDTMEELDFNIKQYRKVHLPNKNKFLIPIKENFIDNRIEARFIFEITTKNSGEIEFFHVEGKEKLNIILNNIYGISRLKFLKKNSNYFKSCISLAREITVYKIVRPINKNTLRDEANFIDKAYGLN